MSADYDPTDPTEKTPLIPGGGGNDDDDDDEWRDVDLSQQKVPEEDSEQWQFPTDTDPNTTNPFEPGASSTPCWWRSHTNCHKTTPRATRGKWRHCRDLFHLRGCSRTRPL